MQHAGGMSAAGMIPFFNTFAIFASRRVYDQIFMCCAYPKLNVKIVGGSGA
jgi:transketolase